MPTGVVLMLLVGTVVLGGVALAAPGDTTGGPPGSTTPTATPNQPTNGTQQQQNNNNRNNNNNNNNKKDDNNGLLDQAVETGEGVYDWTKRFISDPIGTMTQAADSAYRGTMKAILGPLVTAMVEVPTFGIGLTDGNPGIHTPTRWPFKQLLPLYIAIQAFTSLILMIAVAVSFLRIGVPTQNTFRATQTSVRVLKALFTAVVFHLLLIAILHTTVNEIALAIAPSPKELSGDLVKVLTTTAVAGMIGAGMGEAVITNLVKMWTLVWAALMFFPVISGPFIALWQMRPESTLGRVSGTLLWLYFGLLLSKILVAFDLRAAWMLDWKLGPLGALNVMLTIGLFTIAFLIPPAVLIAVLFTRSKALSNLASWTGGAVAGSAVGQKASAKGKEVKEAAHERVKDKGSEYKDRATEHTRTTAANTKQRVSTATGTQSGGRVGHYPREQRDSGDETYRSWSEESADTATGDDTAPDDTAESDAKADRDEAANTQTTAQEVRNLEGRAKDRGQPTPAERQRYHDLQDEQKYDEQVRDQEKSSAQRSAERRYANTNRGSSDSGGLHSERSTTTTSRASERTSHPDDAPLNQASTVHHHDTDPQHQHQDHDQEQDQDQQDGGDA
jgi:hypothetical protein